MTRPAYPEFIEALMQPGVLASAREPVELIETHISWVLLAGDRAYKLKKPLDLGFLDFSTLEKRRAACEEELRLNGRLAPQIYEAVVPITGSACAPQLDGNGPVLDYAVRMQRFAQSQLLDHLQRHGRLTTALLDTAAAEIARFHHQLTPAAADSPHGTPERVWAPAEQNFVQIDTTPLARSERPRLDALRTWSAREHTTKRAAFLQRKAEGHIRECHGDLHLGNMVAIDEQVVLFDCIEFNADLRWIDTLSEAAFLVMDLEDRGEAALAHRCLNRYLELTGDYRGITVLRFYLVYRSLVRAKVNAIRSAQGGIAPGDRERTLGAAADYLALAERYTRPIAPRLYLTHGLSGSGKTTLTQQLLEARGMLRIRSDVERKRLAGLSAGDRSASALAQGLYEPAMTARTYTVLQALAAAILRAGWPVIVDAAFLRAEQRAPFFALAEGLNAPVTLLHFDAPAGILKERISRRLREGADASEADLGVLRHQIDHCEPLTPAERSHAIEFDTREPDCMARWIRHALPAS